MSLTNAVRRACEDDVARIVKLTNRALHGSTGAGRTATSTDEVRERQRRGQYLVLDGDDGTLAACLFLEIHDARGRFGKLAVDPALPADELAQRLISVAELLCEAEGCESMELEVDRGDQPIPALYRSLGYRPQMARPDATDATSDDVTTISKAL